MPYGVVFVRSLRYYHTTDHVDAIIFASSFSLFLSLVFNMKHLNTVQWDSSVDLLSAEPETIILIDLLLLEIQIVLIKQTVEYLQTLYSAPTVKNREKKLDNTLHCCVL